MLFFNWLTCYGIMCHSNSGLDFTDIKFINKTVVCQPSIGALVAFLVVKKRYQISKQTGVVVVICATALISMLKIIKY